MKYKDYYEILGVDRSSTDAQIKSAYRKLARKYHPDVNKSADAVDKFKDINESYEVLSDKEKRSRYDSLGANWNQGSDFTPPPGFDGFNFNQGGFGGGQTYTHGFEGGGDFSDFFSSLFGDLMGGQRAQRQRQGGFSYEDLGGFASRGQARQKTHPKNTNLDVTQELNVSAKDLMQDKPISVKLNTMEKCMKCNGVGSICHSCGGTGFVTNSKNLSVKIPKGIKEGQKIRLSKEGKSDDYGQKGDLYFVIKFKDKDYTINGEDLTKVVEITPSDAVLGCKKDISTLHGTVGIKIPAKTQSGKTLRLKDLGLPKKSGGFGNLNVKISINIPSDLSEAQIELYKKLSELEKK
ncbi:MAG: DnaJ C-terminal domain-containing protein [Candidatus Gastranaerophilales bacterium]|nr:DnaJ C-terminal domain-containing protein [Candidatus Gastranaerophilales bacterium]